jgi:2-polyprenyl-6-methoxyphenol hydroxylase-like FAD-dependent oxidoreductase
MKLLEQGSKNHHRDTTTIPSSVTLVGDAAHPMSPFKGQGANQALLDALSLARSLYATCCLRGDKITSPSNSIRDAIHKYHQEMTVRSAKKVQASAQAAQFLHTDVAIQQGNMTRGAAAAAAAANNTANRNS